ncbi:MAG TPA: site-specific integrase [Thermoanaerobaculia bacterium]|nr:site-specific integrase [Thermoanaerobaculia bacterium]HUM30794.1 site-specific integrase [Thermoanaerobaculia bacterium]HXK69006.1 site-specific integrase [Thermoanaerobaculia bacterium]
MTKGLYQRGNIWWIRYAGPDGRMIYESSRSRNRKDAEELLYRRKLDVRSGDLHDIVRIKRHKFSELAESYLSWCTPQRSYRDKQWMVGFLVKKYGGLPLQKFGTRQVEHLQTELLNDGKKPASVNRILRTLSHMFTKAVDWEMVDKTVHDRIRRVKMLPEDNKRLRYLTLEECHELLRVCDDHLKPIVIMALNTGMRRGEILNLRWDNIDMKNGFILLDQSQTKNKQRREIPINDTVRQTLQSITRRLDVPYIFINPGTGKPFREIKNGFWSALRRAKIQDFRFHDLRHTFASHLVMSGVDIATVKDLLGHKTLEMTLRYAHLAPSHKINAVTILDNRLNESQLYKNYTVGS